MSLFRGLLAYPITPADASGRVDTEALGALVDRLATDGVDGIGLLGSTGTAVFLEPAERRRAVRAAVEAVRGRIPVTVGVGALRTDAAQQLARDAAEEGADGLLLAPVSYTPLLPDEVFAHVAAVASATELPLCVYDNPATTRFEFDDVLLRRLAGVPGVASIKRPAPQQQVSRWLETQRSLFAPGFPVGCSVDWHASEAVLAGADAWHSVLAGVLPAPCLALMRAARTGDGELGRHLDAILSPIWALFRAHGSVRVVHAMANQLGVAGAVPPRPILPLSGEALAETCAALERIDR